MPKVSMKRAREVHEKVLIIDGHNDTLVERIHRGERPLNWMRRDRSYHTDIPRMKKVGYDVGFLVVGNGPTANLYATLEQTLTQVEAHPDDLLLVRSSRDAARAKKTGRVGVLMTVEGGGNWLQGDLDVLRLWHRLGIRCVGLTHGEGGREPEYLQDGQSPFEMCTARDRKGARRGGAALTPFGRDVLRESNEMGLVTDLSHISDKAFYQVLELSTRPVAMTHTAVFSLCPHWRCLTDDQIRALAGAGGVMGIAFVPYFIDPEEPTMDRLVEHICYVGDLVGIDHVAIGTDFDGMGENTPIVPDVSQLVHLTRCMLAHGLLEDDIGKVWGGNFLRILRGTIDGSR